MFSLPRKGHHNHSVVDNDGRASSTDMSVPNGHADSDMHGSNLGMTAAPMVGKLDISGAKPVNVKVPDLSHLTGPDDNVLPLLGGLAAFSLNIPCGDLTSTNVVRPLSPSCTGFDQ